MAHAMTCTSRKSDENEQPFQICFSPGMNGLSVSTRSFKKIIIYPANGQHSSGCSKLEHTTISASSWDTDFHWGNRVACHFTGRYSAYVTSDRASVRVARTDRLKQSPVELRDFHGQVLDIAFAFLDERILVAAVDECSTLVVYEISKSSAHLVLTVNPENACNATTKCHRVVWCQPDTSTARNDFFAQSVDRALMLAVSYNRRVQVWHVGQVNGTVSYSNVTAGTTEMACFDGDIIDLSFTPDASTIAVASLDGYVTIFDVNLNKESPTILKKWQPHNAEPLSAIYFLNTPSNLQDRGQPWFVTSAINNTEFKLWSMQLWKCHQTLCFQTESLASIFQKVALDVTGAFLVISDIHRRVVYVVQIEQDRVVNDSPAEDGEEARFSTIYKVSSINQILLPFSSMCVAIREASIGSSFLPVGDAKAQCTIKLLMLQFQTVKLGKFVFASETVGAPTVQLISNMDRISVVLGQVKESLSEEKKITFQQLSQEFLENVQTLLAAVDKSAILQQVAVNLDFVAPDVVFQPSIQPTNLTTRHLSVLNESNRFDGEDQSTSSTVTAYTAVRVHDPVLVQQVFRSPSTVVTALAALMGVPPSPEKVEVTARPVRNFEPSTVPEPAVTQIDSELVYNLSTNLQQGWAAESNSPDFAPISPLPTMLVAAKTGEEDEQVIFSHRAYLCIRSNISTIWNSIGLGVITILRIKDSGDSRIVFTRDIGEEQPCNHWITKDMCLIPESIHGWSWSALDSTVYGISFVNAYCATIFQNSFVECSQLLEKKGASSLPVCESKQTTVPEQERAERVVSLVVASHSSSPTEPKTSANFFQEFRHVV